MIRLIFIFGEPMKLFGKKKGDVRPSVLATEGGMNDFERSVFRAKASEISTKPNMTREKLLRVSVYDAIRNAMMVCCVLVFLAACLYLVIYGLQYAKNQEELDFLSDFLHDESNSGGMISVARKPGANVNTLTVDRSMAGEVIIDVNQKEDVYNEELEAMRSKLYSLMRQNSDLWGWISIPNTHIDFPIMLASDNDYYLYRSFNKEYNRNGSIFADFRTRDSLEDNKNLVIYGHNMASTGAMFAPLLEFTQEDIYKTRQITITTLDGIYDYKVFAIYNSSPTYNYIKTNFSSDENFLNFIEACKDRSLYSRDDVVLDENSKLLTLSTCTVQQDDRRWAIHAVLVGVSK